MAKKYVKLKSKRGTAKFSVVEVLPSLDKIFEDASAKHAKKIKVVSGKKVVHYSRVSDTGAFLVEPPRGRGDRFRLDEVSKYELVKTADKLKGFRKPRAEGRVWGIEECEAVPSPRGNLASAIIRMFLDYIGGY